MNSLRYICAMRSLRSIFDFYINSSIHVALAVCSLTEISYLSLKLPPDTLLLGFIFFGTITGYNFVKYAGVAKLYHHRLSNSLKILQLFSLFAFILAGLFALQLPTNTLFACVPLGLLTLFYAVPLSPGKNNLRTLPSIKIFVIAAVWAGTTVYLPAAHNDLDLANGHLWGLVVARFFLILALILPFEIRDVSYDAIGLNTLPQIMGTKRTKFFGYVLLCCFMGLHLYLWLGSALDFQWFIPISLTLMTFLSIFLARKKQGHYYCSFWVEGIPIFTWLLYVIIWKAPYL